MKTAAGLACLVLGLLATTSLQAAPVPLSDVQMDDIVAGENFTIVNEVVDDQTTASAPVTDPNLKNSWGLSEGPGTALWVADNGTGVSTLYNASTFAKAPLVVTIPGAGGTQGAPTGTVFTSGAGTGFQVMETAGGQTASVHSLFLFDGEDGTISGWGVIRPASGPPLIPTTAAIAVDQSASGAAFKGLAIFEPNASGPNPDAGATIYAADFTQNKVEMFDSNFHQIGSFKNPYAFLGFSPFNVQQLNGLIYVSYAKRSDGIDEKDGPGLGILDVFNPSGQRLRTLAIGGPLNAPWGMTIAPPNWGRFAGALLVGNFGDGKINAYDPKTGLFLGSLRGPDFKKLSIDGLWAMLDGPDGAVTFSSGPNGEANGLIGVIRPTMAPASWAFQSHVAMNR
ncbi:MAG: TIGR03118 family protein [Caulobacteraceae bacterium]|nr:TIGR03118 family protein [Caulobacteraceae bacterium]